MAQTLRLWAHITCLCVALPVGAQHAGDRPQTAFDRSDIVTDEELYSLPPHVGSHVLDMLEHGSRYRAAIRLLVEQHQTQHGLSGCEGGDPMEAQDGFNV